MNYHFFWNGPLSNWYPSKFTFRHDTFNCAEQAMMYEKAIYFGDMETANGIMKADSPKIQKQLGRSVRGFDHNKWDLVKYDIVSNILHQKFELPYFKSYLMEYIGCIFVEASPYDRIWGIGYSEKDALNNIENWGENLLGKIITEISLKLIDEKQ